ncbi:putative malate dehydrogenase [Phaeomoniella chlamydospora]|uniref:Putative malate dehydrogenase n=1 Tax=Phaeomoniella chlamydospora TaxID=158046 RepID=A0A0G2G091_PHACM|nr:putative malate dehydrogenase [Phaeomoniella chlamydospora]
MWRSILLVASLALTALSAPTSTTEKREAMKMAYTYSPELASFYNAVSKEINNIKDTASYQANDACNMASANANFPSSPTALPAPNNGSSLKHVLLAMGTQNYTCPSTLNASATPTAIGAYANLFNVSCIAANYPSLLDSLPVLAYQYKLPSTYYPTAGTVGESPETSLSSDYAMQPLNIVYSGVHTFYNTTTPRFDLDSGDVNNGLILGKKVANSTAWPNATQGEYGAVPYLKLDVEENEDTSTESYTNVYRMLTQGGSNPKTCENYTGEFSIEYTGLYYIYGM